MKKIKTRIPSNRTIIHKRREKTNFLLCANCGTKLHGVPRGTKHELRNLSISEKVPSRKYGGQLCSSCSKEIFREKARSV